MASTKQGSPAEPLNRYLARYSAVNDEISLPGLRNYRYCLIVPAFDEPTDFLDRVLPALVKDLLVIVVVNAPANASQEQIEHTRRLLTPHQPKFEHRVLNEQNRVDALFCNLVDPLVNPKQGVGRARKWGNDLACYLMQQGAVHHHLLCNTDADAELPADYFAQLDGFLATQPDNSGAAIMPFRHTHTNSDLAKAGEIYELSVRYIARQLARCGCPYAYPSLGSTLVLRANAYASVRGFPLRAAGEDFYLLNKLAKTSTVYQLTGTPIHLASRLSHRVPFGTGPALMKIREKNHETTTAESGEPTQFDCDTYADASFDLLAYFYTGYKELSVATKRVATKVPVAWRDPDIVFLLKHLGFHRNFARITANASTKTVLQKAVHEWFDGIKVIRFLNAARHFHKDEPLLARARRELGLAQGDAASLNRLSETSRLPTKHGISELIVNQVAQSSATKRTDGELR